LEVDAMTVPQDPYLAGGPLPPPAPRDPNAGTVLDESERGEDEGREAVMNAEVAGLDRPLTEDEEDAAKHDPGRQPRTFAPSSERVQKAANPGDAKMIEAGENQPMSPEAARHPGDRSDPSEMQR
jgi:hypothetical protein